ncbi:hypothetical protein C0992_001271 [Termitomyces sp. T32_za158]|nr:hypothetical protein C0992_001271 [Termitomyces sp. T32_za158]
MFAYPPASSSSRPFPPSSPPRSSSPPTTPAKYRGVRVGIRSSPGFGLEIRKEEPDDGDGEVLRAWRAPRDVWAKHTRLPGIRSLFAQELHSASSELAHSASEDDDDDDDEGTDSDSDGLDFTAFDARATFFRVSAERGRWRYDPPRPQVLHRQSTPLSSPPPLSGLNMPIRPDSEPLPSISTPAEAEADTPSCADLLSVIASTDGDRDAEPRAYSPLPPSSPPLSSSPLPAMRSMSMSPLSFAPSSPRLPPSSPLSFLDSLPPSDEQEGEPVLDGEAAAAVVARELFGAEVGEQGLDVNAEEKEADVDVKEKEADVNVDVEEKEMDADVDADEPERLGLALHLTQRKGKATSKLKDEEALRTMDENGVGGRVNKTREGKKRKERESEGGVLSNKKAKAGVSLELESGSGSGSGLGLVEKKTKEGKRRFEEDHEEENEPAPKQKKQKQKQKQKKVEGVMSSQPKRRLEGMASSSSTSTSTSKQKKTLTAHASSSTPSQSSSRSQSPSPSSSKSPSREDNASQPQSPKNKSTPQSPTSLPPPPLPDPESAALHAEIRGMLIESMAASRASSLPASALYRSTMQCRPSLGALRSEKEWVRIIERVLGEGEAAAGGCGVFGKVESSFKDDSGRPLEAQWFYVPEKDEDQERAALIRSMMPRPAKRNETKKYKQYYYRPLAKITRWDREEDL